MPDRLKDKRRPFIFNLADIFLNPNGSTIRDVYDDADTYLFGKSKKDLKKEKKDEPH